MLQININITMYDIIFIYVCWFLLYASYKDFIKYINLQESNLCSKCLTKLKY